MNYISRMLPKSFFIATLVIAGQIISFGNSSFNSAQAKCSPAILSAESESPTVTEETINGKCYVVTKVLVKAKPEQVWQVLTDYRHASQVFPLLKKCEVIKDQGTTKITKHEIAPSGIPDTFEYILEVHECSPKSMEWKRISGDFKEVDGSWKLEPANLGKYTLVTYASHVTGGFLMPQMIIKPQSHIDMPTTLLALKKHTENSIQIASRKTDLSANPQ